MKRALFLAAVVSLVASTGAAQDEPVRLGKKDGRTAAPQSKAVLTVHVRGARNKDGRLALALFDRASAFPDQEKAARGRMVRLSKDVQSITFSGLKPGRYALAVLHDENANGKMDFNFIGIPTEGFGFSNDASAPFGPPSFAESALKLGKADKQVTVNLKYYL